MAWLATLCVVLTILGFSGGIVFQGMFALAGAAWPEGGRKAFNTIYLAQNVGVAVGPALAGIVADYQFDYVFKVNLGMYILFFLLPYLHLSVWRQAALHLKMS